MAGSEHNVRNSVIGVDIRVATGDRIMLAGDVDGIL
jgi:hypothetical protein